MLDNKKAASLQRALIRASASLLSLNISQPLGGTGNLPVAPGYQPGERARSDVSHRTVLVSTGCPSHSGRQVADQNRLVACSTHPEKSSMNYYGWSVFEKSCAGSTGDPPVPSGDSPGYCLAVAVVALRHPRRVQRRNGSHRPRGLRKPLRR